MVPDPSDSDLFWHTIASERIVDCRIFELYRDDDALAEHSSSDAMRDLLGALGPLVAEPPLMVFATPSDAKGFGV